ncbi:MAG TPA: peptidase domain-containing ABC transporter, partial [Ideonella sp.]|nr:peptidase domain-containing ABC transporter [Ideonella sp.]
MLTFLPGARTPLILQAEAAECGLACLAMVAGYHGHRTDLPTLRLNHPASLRGANLTQLMGLAGELDLAPRPLRLEMDGLAELALPCILHWDLNHFVVLTHVGRRLRVHDPAMGVRSLSREAFSKHFTGVALELTPTAAFRPRVERQRVRLRDLVGRLPGLGGHVAQALMLALVVQLCLLLAPLHMQWVVDQALVTQDRDLVTLLGVGFLLLTALHAASAALRGWVLMVLGTSLNLQMLSRLFLHLLRLPMDWFEKRHVGDIVSRFESQSSIQRTLTGGALESLIDGAMAAVTLVLMASYSLPLTAVAVLALAAYAGLRLALFDTARQANEETIVCSARQRTHLLETLRAMQCVKLYAHEGPRGMAWRNLAVDEVNAGIRAQRVALAASAAHTLLFSAENVASIWLGALLVMRVGEGSGLTVGMLMAFFAYKLQFAQRGGALVDKLLELRMLVLHTQRVADIALAAPEPPPLAGAPNSEPLQACIEFKHVWFRYADSEPWVLQDVSLRIEAGECVAISGPSGGGKTTLVKLLLGLLKPTEGSIEVGGQPLSQLGAGYRALIATVMQDDQLFAGSVAENISLFDTQPDFARIDQSARLAAVHDDIMALPMQYRSLVGDMGSAFSGGQRQRLLLARALYRQPQILVMDEATSHLDVQREQQVNEAIGGMRLTRLIVAHRPETIATAERVLHLAGGR